MSVNRNVTVPVFIGVRVPLHGLTVRQQHFACRGAQQDWTIRGGLSPNVRPNPVESQARVAELEAVDFCRPEEGEGKGGGAH